MKPTREQWIIVYLSIVAIVIALIMTLFSCSPLPTINCQGISVAVCQTLIQTGKPCVIETGWRADGVKHSRPRVGNRCYWSDGSYGAAIREVDCEPLRDAVEMSLERYVQQKWR